MVFLLLTSFHLLPGFNLVLAGIESTQLFSSRCNNGVLKSASVINSSNIASGSVLCMASGVTVRLDQYKGW